MKTILVLRKVIFYTFTFLGWFNMVRYIWGAVLFGGEYGEVNLFFNLYGEMWREFIEFNAVFIFIIVSIILEIREVKQKKVKENVIKIDEIMLLFFKLHDKANTFIGLEDNDLDIINKSEDGFYFSLKEKNYVRIDFIEEKRKNGEKFFIIRDFNEVELVNFKK